MKTISYTRPGTRPAPMLRIVAPLDKSTEMMISVDDKDWIAYYHYEYTAPTGERVYSLMDVMIKDEEHKE